MVVSAILTLRDVEMARDFVFKFRRSVKVGFPWLSTAVATIYEICGGISI